MQREKILPWLVFKLNSVSYAIQSGVIVSIVKLPDDIAAAPNAPDYIMGMMRFRNRVIPLLDMRLLFGMPSLKQEYDAFRDMLEARKQDHIHWVEELERSFHSGEKFSLAIDPRDCAFGKWYYSFHSDLQAVDFHLKKIEQPHRELHGTVLKMNQCMRMRELGERQECVEKALDKAKEKLATQIIQLLEQAKDVFKHSFQEMVIVHEDEELQIGIVVDEVLAVEHLPLISGADEMKTLLRAKCITAIGQSGQSGEMVLMVDEKELLDAVKGAGGKGDWEAARVI